MTEQQDPHPRVILGLFAHERDADTALSKLAVAGLNQEAIKVINETEMEEATPDIPYPAFEAGASLGHMRPEPETTPGKDLAEDTVPDPRSDLQSLLEGLKLARDEAYYYANGVYEGGTLVMVQVENDGERAQVYEILETAGAANFTH